MSRGPIAAVEGSGAVQGVGVAVTSLESRRRLVQDVSSDVPSFTSQESVG